MLPTTPRSTYFPLRMLEKFLHELVLTFLKFFKVAFDRHAPFIEQCQTVGNGLRAVQIVSHYDGRHVMFLLQLKNQIIDLRGTDRGETSRGLVEQQNIRLESQGTCQPYSFLHAARNI